MRTCNYPLCHRNAESGSTLCDRHLVIATVEEEEATLNADLEVLVDKHGLANVMNALAEVCYAKADHISESYNDKGLAEDWNDIAMSLVYSVRNL